MCIFEDILCNSAGVLDEWCFTFVVSFLVVLTGTGLNLQLWVVVLFKYDDVYLVGQRTADYLQVVSAGYFFGSRPERWCESSAGNIDTESGTKLTPDCLCLVPAMLAFQHWSFRMVLRVQSK